MMCYAIVGPELAISLPCLALPCFALLCLALPCFALLCLALLCWRLVTGDTRFLALTQCVTNTLVRVPNLVKH